MALSALDYPTDVRWERMCVTQDMLDPEGCDQVAPPRWQTSIAVFRYVPDDEYQVYPGRRIIYYKVSCTITGYQPQSEEIGAAIDWNKLTLQEVQDYEKALTEPLPCHGALVQVTVTAPGSTRRSDHPYFLDFQPKQRLLYEQVSDTAETASRSVETLNVRKGAGSTQSVELLDIDQGFSAGAQGSYAGTGGGFNVSHSGQWGTKQLGEAESNTLRTVDASRESRDTLSHTTQLSQMYTLLQGYHVGTNRALFFVAPRPHPQEEVSGFFRTPRRLDGIQEFFLIVSQAEKQETPCLSVRLDTSHLTVTSTYDYERKPADRLAEAAAVTPIPTRQNTAFVGTSPDLLYDIRQVTVPDSDVYDAPSGFVVESVTDVEATATPFSSSMVDISADRRHVTVSGTAAGRGEFRNTAGDAANTAALASAGTVFGGPLGTLGGLIAAAAGADVFPDERNIASGAFSRRVRIDLKSEQPTVKTGERTVLLLSSRGLCCCEHGGHKEFAGPKVVGARQIDDRYLERVKGDKRPPPEEVKAAAAQLEQEIADTTRQLSLAVPQVAEAKALDNSIVLARLTEAAVSRMSAETLAQPPASLAGQHLKRTAKMLGKGPNEVTRADILGSPGAVAAAAKLSPKGLMRLHLDALGVPGISDAPAANARKAATSARKRNR